jgi:hypothetical protein
MMGLMIIIACLKTTGSSGSQERRLLLLPELAAQLHVAMVDEAELGSQSYDDVRA